MESSTDTVQSATNTDTLIRLLVAISCGSESIERGHSLIFVQAADRLSTLQSELTRAREREKELVEALRFLEGAASQVSRLGAVTGPQWVKLTSAIISARSAVKKFTSLGEALDGIENENSALAGGKP